MVLPAMMAIGVLGGKSSTPNAVGFWQMRGQDGPNGRSSVAGPRGRPNKPISPARKQSTAVAHATTEKAALLAVRWASDNASEADASPKLPGPPATA